jgi:hypothetical protein
MQHMSGVWGALGGWVTVLAGLAVLAGLIRWADRRRPASPRHDAEARDPTTLDPRREWELVMHSASEGLSRRADLAALQADTALKIEAAEHAFNRLVADFAKLCATSAPPPVAEPAPLPVSTPEAAPRESEKVAEQPPLAA